jgi:hypothetical protein
MEKPLLGMHYAANLERARSHYRQERHTINQQGPAWGCPGFVDRSLGVTP